MQEPSGTDNAEVTRLLARLDAGVPDGEREVWALVYEELRRIAGNHLRHERPGHTLDATALVHEVWLRVGDSATRGKANRAEVLAYASRAMRSLLVDHARRRDAERRGGHRARVTLRETLDAERPRTVDVIELSNALECLTETDDELGRIAELHLFGGLTQAEVAESLGLPLRTLERRWRVASTWLKRELAG